MNSQDAKSILNSRKLIAIPGAYELKCTSITPFEGKFIANFSAMTSYHLEEAKSAFSEGDYQKAINNSVSASLRATDYLPSKGEIVKVQIENLTTNNGVTGLFVTSVSQTKAIQASKVSFDFEDDFEEVELANTINDAAKDSKANVAKDSKASKAK